MTLNSALQQVDAGTAQAFVRAARHVIDAMMIEAQRVHQAQAPGARDYLGGDLSREAAAGGWISHEELRSTTQKLSEAIAAEKWIDGLLTAVRLIALLGG